MTGTNISCKNYRILCKKKGILNEYNTKFTTSESSGITLTNNGIKDIMKVIRSLEDTRNLLKGTTRKDNSQKGRLLIFFYVLTRLALLLIRN